MASFSIIIPTHNRSEKVTRAINSVLAQTYRDFEIIVIDDGSIDDTFEKIKQLQNLGVDKVPLIYIRQVRQQRLIARNKGMQQATKDWIVWMDDDDELFPDYLEEFNKSILKNPMVFVHQCSVQFYKIIDGEERKLRILKPVQDVKRHFTSGCITTGQFIFNSICLLKINMLPHTHLYGEFAIQSGIPGYGWVEPQPPRFPEKRVQVLGNPWGEDYYMFYKLTRFFDVASIDKILYKKNCR